MLKAMSSQLMPGKRDEEIVSWLNQHIFFESGYDITEGPFPLPATIGEGFRFQSLDFLGKNVVDYVTKAIRKKMISVCYILGFQLLSGYVEEPVIISVRHIQQFTTQMSMIHPIILVDILQV